MSAIQYLVDFDRTVFDVEQLYQLLEEVTGESRGGAYAGTLQSLRDERIDISKLLFSDFIAFAKQHDRSEFHIISSCDGVSGQWNMEYQKEKIMKSGIDNWVEHIHVVRDEKESVLRDLTSQSGRFVFIDDRPVFIHAAQKLQQEGIAILPVLINRMGTPEHGDLIEITSFSELDATIEKWALKT